MKTKQAVRFSAVLLCVASASWIVSARSGANGAGQRQGGDVESKKLEKLYKDNQGELDKLIQENPKEAKRVQKALENGNVPISDDKRAALEKEMSRYFAGTKLPSVVVAGKVGDTATGQVVEANGVAAVVADPCVRAPQKEPAIFQRPYTKTKVRDVTCPPDNRVVTIWELVQQK